MVPSQRLVQAPFVVHRGCCGVQELRFHWHLTDHHERIMYAGVSLYKKAGGRVAEVGLNIIPTLPCPENITSDCSPTAFDLKFEHSSSTFRRFI